MMAKLELSLQGDFREILNRIVSGIQNSSMSASLEDASDFCGEGAPMQRACF